MKQTRGKAPVFTVADHLKVQMQIEQRARELWLAGGSPQNTTLDNWLEAEREVVEEFIQEVTHGRPHVEYQVPEDFIIKHQGSL